MRTRGRFSALLIASTSAIAIAGLAVQGPLSARSSDRPACRGAEATVVGSTASDRIEGSEQRDVIVARSGADHIEALGGPDLICAGPGEDRVIAGGGDDKVDGGAGDDFLRGRGGGDTVRGQTGQDRVSGDKGSPDVCLGGAPRPDNFANGDLAAAETCSKIRSAYRIGRFD
jgi:Ca2+-binding RTX toxin-like protein